MKKDLGKERFVVLDVAGNNGNNGIGYKVFLSKKTYEKWSDLGSPTTLFCYFYVRENIMDLYGFANWEEREVFELLLGISGVGPKAAIEISALGPLEKLKKAIDAGDGKIFEGIPGIGKKRIAKILLELSGRIKGLEAPARAGAGPHTPGGVGAGADEDPCVDALVNMGFSKIQSRQALEQIPKSISEEDRIKEALKLLK